MKARFVSACLLLALAAAACSSKSPEPAASQASNSTGTTIEATDNFKFLPGIASAKVGDVVTWHNTGATAHTVTFKTGGTFDTPLPPGGTVTYVAEKAGAITYVCTIHVASKMKGVINVG